MKLMDPYDSYIPDTKDMYCCDGIDYVNGQKNRVVWQKLVYIMTSKLILTKISLYNELFSN